MEYGIWSNLWTGIKEAYTSSVEEVLGYRKNQKTAPWISEEVLELSDKRRLLKATKALNEEDRRKYNKITRDIKNLSKQCKDKWIEEKCSTLENSAKNQNIRLLYKTAKEICGTFSAKLPTATSKEGKTLDDNCQVKERCKEHFNDLYNTQNPIEATVLWDLPANNNKQEYMEDFLTEEVEMAIKKLKPVRHLAPIILQQK